MLTLTLAWRNLFRNTRRTILTTLLISFSLTALILTDGLVLGMIELMVGSITQTLSGEAQIHRRGFLEDYDNELFIEDPTAIFRKLDDNADVKAYAPRVMVGGMITSPYNVAGGLVYGVDGARETGVSRIRDALIEGEYLTGGHRELLVGEPMAALLEVSLGDRIVITASDAITGEISQDLFRVSGIFKFGPTELDENVVFINLPAAQQLTGVGDGVHQIVIQFVNQALARDRTHAAYTGINSESIESIGWLDYNPGIAGMIEWASYSTAIVAVILFFLASVGVINSMFMSIYERIYEIGVIRAIGTTPGAIVRLVLTEALLIALLSCVSGSAFGFLLSGYFGTVGIPFGGMETAGVVIENVYTRMAVEQFTSYPIYVVVLTLIAALYPSIFAARITPAEALQRSL